MQSDSKGVVSEVWQKDFLQSVQRRVILILAGFGSLLKWGGGKKREERERGESNGTRKIGIVEGR